MFGQDLTSINYYMSLQNPSKCKGCIHIIPSCQLGGWKKAVRVLARVELMWHGCQKQPKGERRDGRPLHRPQGPIVSSPNSPQKLSNKIAINQCCIPFLGLNIVMNLSWRDRLLGKSKLSQEGTRKTDIEPKMEVWKISFLFKGVISVDFQVPFWFGGVEPFAFLGRSIVGGAAGRSA